MKVTILDDIGEENKIAIRWVLKATHEKDFANFSATHKKFETQGADIFHFEGDKIKEAWTVCDMAVLAQWLNCLKFLNYNLYWVDILGSAHLISLQFRSRYYHPWNNNPYPFGHEYLYSYGMIVAILNLIFVEHVPM